MGRGRRTLHPVAQPPVRHRDWRTVGADELSSEEHYRRLERLYAEAPTNAYYRPSIEIAEATATVRIPIRDEFFHVAGAVHGSHYFKALDDAAFFAVASLDAEHFPLTASFNMYLERPISSGTLVATGEVIQRARRVFLAESKLYDDSGRELARGSGTFMPSSTPWADLI